LEACFNGCFFVGLGRSAVTGLKGLARGVVCTGLKGFGFGAVAKEGRAIGLNLVFIGEVALGSSPGLSVR